MPEGLNKLTEGISKAAETVPDLYDDVLKPTTQESGKLLALIPHTINAALVPLRQWIANREYNLAETEKLLSEKLKNVSADKIVTPEPYVAIPAIQAISYSMNSKELRELYANLLAKSMNSDTKDSVHPAYVDVIKTMSPLDCLVLDYVMKSRHQQIGAYEFRTGAVGERAYSLLLPYVTAMDFGDVDTIALSIDNLSRNKLLYPDDFHYTDDSMYAPIRNTVVYIAYSKAYESFLNDQEFRPYKIAIKSTSFGRAFHNICAKGFN